MAHQSKRPYAGTRAASQSAITSYFTHSKGTTATKQALYALPPHHSTSCTNNTPSLPPSVQSNLLNVGMRVRKSVPEGYKTGTFSAFTLFADNTTSTSSPTSTMPDTTSTSPSVKTRPRSGNRELTPFCGILKVGGMAGQQWGIYNPSGAGGDMDEDTSSSDDEVPFLSSQGSTISSSSVEGVSPPGGNKRRFFEDEESTSNSAMNFGFGFNSNPNSALGDRVLAVPRRKKWSGKVPVHTVGQVRIFGQENFNMGGSGVGGGKEDVDFGDAEFLDYGLAGEVEMSGCN
ncbi:ribonucleotide reductase inhibitor-domain-containing protein [Rhexocercosporidium sp. MPI-PUGE-AT-0058]|nr:ribonucleotide reductase inhibitor-domain-containing protein [Rhexocercosporidium sp. MPI-PUGE-AT-0058]